MDNIMDKVQEMLSDPESLKQIQELADMIGSEMGNSQNTQPQENTPPPTNNMNNSNNNNSSNSTNSDFDFSKIFQIIQLFNNTSNSQDTTLLLAIKPYLTSERQVKVDKAIKLMKAYDIFTTAKNSGLLNNLDSLI